MYHRKSCFLYMIIRKQSDFPMANKKIKNPKAIKRQTTVHNTQHSKLKNEQTNLTENGRLSQTDSSAPNGYAIHFE